MTLNSDFRPFMRYYHLNVEQLKRILYINVHSAISHGHSSSNTHTLNPRVPGCCNGSNSNTFWNSSDFDKMIPVVERFIRLRVK